MCLFFIVIAALNWRKKAFNVNWNSFMNKRGLLTTFDSQIPFRLQRIGLCIKKKGKKRDVDIIHVDCNIKKGCPSLKKGTAFSIHSLLFDIRLSFLPFFSFIQTLYLKLFLKTFSTASPMNSPQKTCLKSYIKKGGPWNSNANFYTTFSAISSNLCKEKRQDIWYLYLYLLWS